MNKYNGIDLLSNNSATVIVNDTDKLLMEMRMPNDLKAILALFKTHRAELIVIVARSTYLYNITTIKSYEG